MEGFTVKSPLGRIFIAESEGKVAKVILNFGKEKDIPPQSPFQRKLKSLFEQYFEGKPVDFSEIPISKEMKFGKIYEILRRKVRWGELVSYSELAELGGYPRSYARVIGNAMAANPIPIIIPCHRVVRADGQIGNFSAGIEWKIYLLELEGHKIQSGRILKRT